MSLDFQIGFPCPHFIVEERTELSSDRRGLVTHAPIAAKGTVSVLVNDEYFIPSTGLYTRAVLRSSESGPYRIVKYEDELTVSNQFSAYTVRLPRGLRVSVNDLVELCNRKFKETGNQSLFAVNVSGFLVFYEVAGSGGNSRVRVKGSAITTLGFRQKAAKGRELYPAWVLEKQMSADGIEYGRFVRFTKPIKTNPVFKVSYTTPSNKCIRCGAAYVENDFRYNSKGDLVLITDENLLYQSCLKALLTVKGSNPYYRWYGTSLMNAIGRKVVMGLQNSIKQEVSNTLRTVQNAQSSQVNYQKISAKERLFSLTSVVVYPHQNDPTAFLVDVVITNASQTPISLSIAYTAPGAVALTGSNGKSLGIK